METLKEPRTFKDKTEEGVNIELIIRYDGNIDYQFSSNLLEVDEGIRIVNYYIQFIDTDGFKIFSYTINDIVDPPSSSTIEDGFSIRGIISINNKGLDLFDTSKVKSYYKQISEIDVSISYR